MNYDEKEGHRPNTSSALGYDAGGVVIEAIERAKTPTRKNVRDALLEVRHEGVTGRIIIDKTRNTMKKVIVLRARPDHTFAFVNAVSPHRGENGDGAQP